ncbi:MAG: response regulator, partial [Desulfuromonadales bacterium]
WGKERTLKKILVIDDQRTIRELVRAALRSAPLQILQAASGEEGVELARQQIPDLVLLDIMLPEGIDGFEVARTLKQDPRTRDIPIVALTAKVQQTDREEAFRAGMDEYLAKPFGLQELRQKIKQFLG